MRSLFVSFLLAFLLSACAVVPTPAERRIHADELAVAHGWQAESLAAGQFELMTYVPRVILRRERLTIYIEGDGLAWLDSMTPSSDPTPRDPLALRLALVQTEGNAAYLARPCQYGNARQDGCSERYWTDARFAPEVVAASSLAVDRLKARFGAQQLTLVGYSGGAAIAALLAARRSDVSDLVTVAGNLDHRAWTTHHRVTPLSRSLNPADDIGQLGGVRQMHFVGLADRIVPSWLTLKFIERFSWTQQPVVKQMEGFDHVCCWAHIWPELLREAALPM